MAEQTVPIMKVAVVGRYRDDTTYLLKQLEEWCARRPVQTKVPDAATPERGDTIMLVNDFGPQLGAPRYWSIQGSKRRYQVWECVEGFQSLIASLPRDVSTAVVVLSANESMTPATREFLQILRFLLCKHVIVYVSDAAAVTERPMLDLVELETRETLTEMGFEGDLCTVLFEHEDDREAQAVVLTQLTDALDAIELPVDRATDPFVCSLLDVFAIRQRGMVCVGTVHSGAIELNAPVQLVGLVAQRDCRVGLLNNDFMLRQSDYFAQRIIHETMIAQGTDTVANPASQMPRAFQIAFGRQPTPSEAVAARTLVESRGLPVLCRMLLNANEFAYID